MMLKEIIIVIIMLGLLFIVFCSDSGSNDDLIY